MNSDIQYAIVPNKFVHFAFYFLLSKRTYYLFVLSIVPAPMISFDCLVYVNSLLATLNARGSLLGGNQGKVRVIKVSSRKSSSAAEHNRDQGIEVCNVPR